MQPENLIFDLRGSHEGGGRYIALGFLATLREQRPQLKIQVLVARNDKLTLDNNIEIIRGAFSLLKSCASRYIANDAVKSIYVSVGGLGYFPKSRRICIIHNTLRFERWQLVFKLNLKDIINIAIGRIISIYWFKKFDCVICSSEYLERRIKVICGLENTKVLYNFSPITHNKSRIMRETKSRVLKFVSFSAYSRYKCFEEFLYAFNHIAHQGFCFEFKNFGVIRDKKYYKKLVSLREKLPYLSSDNFSLEPEIPFSEVKSHLLNSHVYVLPSRSETGSLTLLEASSLELPAICRNIGGNTEYINPLMPFNEVTQEEITNCLFAVMLLSELPRGQIRSSIPSRADYYSRLQHLVFGGCN